MGNKSRFGNTDQLENHRSPTSRNAPAQSRLGQGERMSNFWTPEMAAAHNRRIEAGRGRKRTVKQSMTVAATNLRGELLPPSQQLISAVVNGQLKFKPKKPLLNKLESDWKAVLEAREEGATILCQAITFRLGDGLSYRPDFVVIHRFSKEGGFWTYRIDAYETKGQHRFREKGKIKLFAAARIIPWINWVLVTRDGGKWKERTIANE